MTCPSFDASRMQSLVGAEQRQLRQQSQAQPVSSAHVHSLVHGYLVAHAHVDTLRALHLAGQVPSMCALALWLEM
jgi:hypothetical protein